MGDPGGIGPEIAVKALALRPLGGRARVVLVGDAGILREAARRFAPGLCIVPVDDPDAPLEAGCVGVLVPPRLPRLRWHPGTVNARSGSAAYLSLELAVRLALEGRARAVVTAPLHKGALAAAGIEGPGHTEIVARMAGARDVALMLCHGKLRVVHATLHERLADAVRALTARRVTETIALAQEAIRALGIARPKIGLCALNPHAGEGGLFGPEERRILAPAVARARRRGIEASGPHPADTLFVRHLAGEFDGLVALYHDQGHIPFKLAIFRASRRGGGLLVRGVNVTLGLPFVRTSVDHGVALDIAGQGRADETSLVDALKMALRLCKSTVGRRLPQ
jgi:4-hydroxythreonine-4-phosphate dehydrogenase